MRIGKTTMTGWSSAHWSIGAWSPMPGGRLWRIAEVDKVFHALKGMTRPTTKTQKQLPNFVFYNTHGHFSRSIRLPFAYFLFILLNSSLFFIRIPTAARKTGQNPGCFSFVPKPWKIRADKLFYQKFRGLTWNEGIIGSRYRYIAS